MAISQNKIFWFLVFVIGVIFFMTRKIYSSIVEKMANAITEFEDYVLPGGYSRSGEFMPEGSRSFRNNNPGNLRWFGDLDNIPWSGAVGVDESNHVIFDTYQNGRQALLTMLDVDLSGRSNIYSTSMNLYDYFSEYAEENSRSYAEFVASRLGVSPDTTLAQLAVMS